jgi:1,4-dihydroxy-2-naphthoyl-CoA synthase
MELTFAAPEVSGWRGRGAPRRKVPETVLAALRRARDTGKVGILNVQGDSDKDIKDAISALRAGGRDLGRKVSVQYDDSDGVIRFRVGEAQ